VLISHIYTKKTIDFAYIYEKSKKIQKRGQK